jgi:hypothetical protein
MQPQTRIEIVKATQEIDWIKFAGSGSATKICMDGSGGPEAMLNRLESDRPIEPHFHRTAQFQLLITGTMRFPDYQIEGVSIHYTDHCVPYGPFVPQHNQEMLVAHARQGGVAFMKDRAVRKDINYRGRELHGSEHEVQWQPMVECPGARRKVLFGSPDGPMTEIFELPAGAQLARPAAPHGRYDLVLDGSGEINGNPLAIRTLRFYQSRESDAPLIAGAQGLRVVVMTFDSDADQSLGGSVAEDFKHFGEWSSSPLDPERNLSA